MNSGAGLAGLRVREHDEPTPGPREVLVRVRANSLNNRELMILQGTYPLPIRPDVIPLSDGAGEVVAVGSGVSRAKIGDRVAAAVFPRWIDGPFGWEYADQIGGSLDGMLTEFALLSEEAVVHLPDHLSFEEAAALPCAGVTAWNALTGGSALQAGDIVLTQGSGGVSLFVLQLAKCFGARVIATTSSDDKAERLKAAGADSVINYRMRPDWDVAVRELTGGRGVDLVVELSGGDTLEKSVKSAAVSGQISWVGWFSNRVSTIDINAFGANIITLRRIALGSRAQFLAMNRAIGQNQLRPVINRVFPFEEARAAYRYYEEEQPFGKVIISQS